jgi:hypothetical protein
MQGYGSGLGTAIFLEAGSDPHKNETLDQNPHCSHNSEALEAQNKAVKGSGS